MNFPPLSDIKKMRKAQGMTQSQLAEHSGVSQSTIAKIESGSISPSYETVVRLFGVIEMFRNGERTGKCAKDVMSKNIISVQAGATVQEASDIMQNSGFSQLPVFSGTVSVGSISERGIFELMVKGVTMKDLKITPLSKIMGDAYPVVPDNMPVETVTKMMSDCNAILVQKNGKIVGIVTNADVLKLI